MAGQKLGQHFLRSDGILEKIAVAACPDPTGHVLEIGPGKGALTRHLLRHCGKLTAVEVDPELVAYLHEHFAGEAQLTVLAGDILQTDLTALEPFAVAGNLPYYITSPIIEHLLRLRGQMSQAVLLMQKEVAERLVAAPGTRDYGYLTVATQFYAEVKRLFGVPPGAFDPPPKVDSTVVRLTPRVTLPEVDARHFLEFVGRCFAQKRKTLRNNLRPFYPAEVLEAQPEMGLRAEQLGIPILLDLFTRLART